MECLICNKNNSTTEYNDKGTNFLPSISLLFCQLLEISSTCAVHLSTSSICICTGCHEKLMQVHHMMEELDEIQVKIAWIKNEICQDLIKSEEFCQAVGEHGLEIRTKIVQELCSRSRISDGAKNDLGQNDARPMPVAVVVNGPPEAVQNDKESVMKTTKRGRKQRLKPLLVQQQNSPLIDLDSTTTVIAASTDDSFSSTSPRRSSRKRKSNIDSDFIFDQKFFKTEPDSYSQLDWDGSTDNNQNEYVQLISSEDQISSLSDMIGFEVEGYNDHNQNGIGKIKITQEGEAIIQTKINKTNKRGYKRKRKGSKKCNRDGLFQCDLCGVTYDKFSSWRTHRSVHLPKKFICSICDKAFSRKELLISHTFVHSDAQFECSVCLKKYKTKKSLEIHMQIHNGIKNFKCECGKAFTQKINLITHQETHKLEKRGFKCKICGKKLATKEYLGYHVESHVKGKNFTCNYSNCGKSFVKNYMLMSHIKNSHGNQKYSCQLCQLVVKTRFSFIRHLEKIHNNRREIWSVEGYIETCFESGDASKSEIGNDFAPAAEVGTEESEEISEIIPIEAVIETGEMSFIDHSQLFSVSENNVMILQVEGGGEIVLNLDLITNATTTDT